MVFAQEDDDEDQQKRVVGREPREQRRDGLFGMVAGEPAAVGVLLDQCPAGQLIAGEIHLQIRHDFSDRHIGVHAVAEGPVGARAHDVRPRRLELRRRRARKTARANERVGARAQLRLGRLGARLIELRLAPLHQDFAGALVDHDVAVRLELLHAASVVLTLISAQPRSEDRIALGAAQKIGLRLELLAHQLRVGPEQIGPGPIDRNAHASRFGVGDVRGVAAGETDAGRLRRVEARHEDSD